MSEALRLERERLMEQADEEIKRHKEVFGHKFAKSESGFEMDPPSAGL